MVATAFTAQETTVWLDLPNTPGLRLKCLQYGPLQGPVALVVHGKPGKPDGQVNDDTVSYFASRGINCVRPFMYSPADAGTRQLVDCTLQTYTQDLETVAGYVRAHGPSRLFGIGHSYGALAMLKSSVQFDAAVLWEPTHGSYWTEYPGLQHDSLNPLNEFEAMGDTTALAAHKGYPLMIISAGKGKITKFHERYMAVADDPKRLFVVPGARHSLGNTLPVLQSVRLQTADWLAKFI